MKENEKEEDWIRMELTVITGKVGEDTVQMGRKVGEDMVLMGWRRVGNEGRGRMELKKKKKVGKG